MKLHLIFGAIWTFVSIVSLLVYGWEVGLILFMATIMIIFYMSKYESLKKILKEKALLPTPS